ncbi:hypothetical protein HGRIS_007461 [Hohenbuehelia grisea]|uniref:Acyl-protein thioesterase 1 n=1 Tax=Hohenbuehelia grisea TaxID=104357 RepID=A0ABR3J583_9AGAR
MDVNAFRGLVTVPATQAHTATVIFAHGLGQSNLSWRQLIREAFAERLPHVTWILPQAPQRELTLSPGHRRPSWFDLSRLPPPPDDFDEQAMSESSSCIENIILGQVHAGIDSRRIVLIGFSQGAALSLVVALTTLYELAGAVIMSGWLPHRSREVRIALSFEQWADGGYIYVVSAHATHGAEFAYPLVPRDCRR